MMKILWVVNTPIYVDEEHLSSTRGGWMQGALNELKDRLEICIAAPISQIEVTQEIIGSVKYFYFKYDQFENKKLLYDIALEEQLENIIKLCRPDIIHIWGTEYTYSFAMVNAAKHMNMLDRVIINLQGIISIYSGHYLQGIPYKYWKKNSLVEIIKNISMYDNAVSMKKHGEYERQTLKMVKHVIGRTDWDKASVLQINSNLEYHFCNEILRDAFYDGKKWEYNNCERHSIFFTQPSHPIKGFHIMLQALGIIKREYPDVRLYLTGDDFLKRRKIISCLPKRVVQTSYVRFIEDIIDTYGLEKNIHFVGELSKDEMYRQFLKANVFVSASSVENESNSISEAHIIGVPVVASYVGGVTERVRHKIDGYLFPYNEPYMLAYYVCEIFGNISTAEEFSRRGIEAADKINDREINSRQLIDIYGKICYEK